MFMGASGKTRWTWNKWSPKVVTKKSRPVRRVRLELEELESRALLSASGVTAMTNDTTITPAASSAFSGYTPQQLQQAYGISTQINGQDETIAIVDAYNDPNIQQDLAAFDAKYGLPTANLTVVNQTGGSALPANNSSWAVEESLDVEWAHAIAPGANIVLVEANSSSLSNLMTAVHTAGSMSGVNVVSMSWGAGEFSGETAYDSFFQPYSSSNPNGYTNSSPVTFVASAGDESAYYGPEWPASSPDVLAVGGTTLNLTSSNTIASETVWSASYSRYYGMEGGGGGVSAYESTPSFQSSNGVSNAGRSTPDVAWDANPSTGVSIYDSYGEPGWGYVGGTSVGAPSWAGIVAQADQEAGHSLSTAQVESTLYGAYHSSGGANSSSGSAYSSDFNDITSGSNGYAAAKGYDLATGLGSPKVSALISLLASSSTSPAVVSGSTTSGTSSGGSSSAARHQVLLGTDEGASTRGIVSLNLFNVLATNVPIGVSFSGSTAGSSAGTLAAGININNASLAFNLTAEGSPATLTATNVSFGGSLNTFAPQNTTVFGASGWNSTRGSLLLNSHGLNGPTVDRALDDLADPYLEEVEDQPDSPIVDGDGAAGEDAPALEAMPAADGGGDGGE